MTQLAIMLWQVVVQVKRLSMLHKREYRIKFVGLSGLEIPVPALCRLSEHISVLKFMEMKCQICMSTNLGKRGLFGTESSQKSEKGGLIYPTLIE